MSATLALALVDAFNQQELDAFEALLHPEVEVHARRGLKQGPEAAREWATSSEGDLMQVLKVGAAREEGDAVLLGGMKQWVWRENGEVGDETPYFLVLRFRDGLVTRWQGFEDEEDALAAAGLL